LSPTRLFACMTCGQRFELSRVVADSSLSMTLCPECGGHEIQTIGESTRDATPQPATAQPVATEPAAPPVAAQAEAGELASAEDAA
jgi:predicted  nucleic acid-binding Zn-ribbon protein